MTDYKELKKLEEFELYDGTFNSIKNNLSIRLFNKKNLPLDKKLKSIVYKPFADLAVTYSIERNVIKDNKRILEVYMITDEDFETFDIDFEIFDRIATANMQKLNSVRVETIMEHILRENVFSPLTNIPKDAMTLVETKGLDSVNGIFSGRAEKKMPLNNTKDVLLISNRYQTFGSVNLVLPTVLDEVYERLEENFYIVPLSIHESLCIKKSYATKNGTKTEKQVIEDLKDMLEEVNDVVISNQNNILSYNIYYHVNEEKCTLIVN